MKRDVPINKKRFLFIMSTMLFFAFTIESFGQSIWTNPITGEDPSTSNPYKTGETFDADITVSGIGRGAGIFAKDANNRYNARGWSSVTLDSTYYFTLILTAKSGYQINLTNFNYTGQISSTGPINFAFRSSLDNFGTDIGTPTATQNPGTNMTIVLTNPTYQNISTPIEFRIYAWGASNGLGTFSVNDFTFNGTISKSNIDFDGIDDYVDFGDKHGYTSSFSLEAWVLQKAMVTSGTIISKGDIKTSNKRGYHLALNNGKPNLTWYNNFGLPILNITSDYVITTDKWHHIAATYDGTTAKLFVDGLEVSKGTPSGAPTNGAEKFLIGAMNDSGTPTIPKNYFKGYIDEVRIWNTALTTQQIREMMNQEIEINGMAVKGKTIPLNISGALFWRNLVGYYPMNDNNVNDESGNAIKIVGSAKNMTTNQLQTAPLPYVSNDNGTWDANATWLNGTVQNLPNTVGIDGLTPIYWNIVETKHDITSGSRNITLLGMFSESGKLAMDGTTDISSGTGTGQSLRITRYLELDGVIDLAGESQLIQDEGCVLDQDSGGYLERDQQGTANSFNYNYWSSSVGPIIGNSSTKGTGTPSKNDNFTLFGVLKDGTDASNPNKNGAIQFLAPYASADSGVTSPIKISTYWLYTFNGADNNYNSWKSINQNTALLPGEGYTMKGTSGAVTITNLQNYVFKGKPYNGDFTLPIAKGGDRLIGNPYPSAMDADKFIDDNIKDGGSNSVGNVFNGALYFWDHFGQKNSHNLREYVGGYATYTKMGGAKAYSNDERINSNGTYGNKKPGRYIPVNQGFFVIAVMDTLSNSIKDRIVIDGGNIVFKNSQRVFMPETLGNSIFMKGVQSKSVSLERGKEKTLIKTNADLDKRSKIWLQFDSSTGYHRQLLVGVDKNASNNFDLGYDAPIPDIGKEDMYWTFSGSKFVIQGVNNFNNDQELPLGLKISKPGLVRIKIDMIENLNKNLLLGIKDKLTNETFDITEKPFEMMLDAGEYADRFALTFKIKLIADENALLMDEDILVTVKNPLIAEDVSMVQNKQLMDTGVHVFMNNNISELQIKNVMNTEIISINLYNNIGQCVNSWNSNLNKQDISLPINKATGIYFVQINTKNGKTVKKISVE